VSVARQAQAGPIGKAAIWCESSACRITENFIHDAEADTGIHVKNSSVTITGNTFVAVGFGVNVEETADVLVSGNTFTNCAAAVSAFNSAPRVLDNIIQRVGAFACRGIECASTGPANAYAPVVSGNTIIGMQNEAVWCHTVSPVISNNVVRNCYGTNLNYCGNVSFTGNLVVGNSHGVYLFGTPNGTVEGNTFDGNGAGVGVQEGSNPTIVRNIVHGGTVGIECTELSIPVNPVISCNNVFGASVSNYSGTCADQTGVNGNFSADPEFCGIPGSGNYYLQSDSPCAPGNHPDGGSCATIGAYAIGCSTVPVKSATWGGVKSLFRTKERD
jgi:parallel beta-helix repeat protein